jgi:hypothetical protein
MTKSSIANHQNKNPISLEFGFFVAPSLPLPARSYRHCFGTEEKKQDKDKLWVNCSFSVPSFGSVLATTCGVEMDNLMRGVVLTGGHVLSAPFFWLLGLGSVMVKACAPVFSLQDCGRQLVIMRHIVGYGVE